MTGPGKTEFPGGHRLSRGKVGQALPCATLLATLVHGPNLPRLEGPCHQLRKRAWFVCEG